MNYTEYRKTLGLEPASHAPGVTLRDFKFGNNPNEGGMGTIYFLNEIPIMVAWYEWAGEKDLLTKQLQEELAGTVEIRGIQNQGNGHYRAFLKVNGEFHPKFSEPWEKPSKQDNP